MPCLLGLIALIVPRVLILTLFFITDWFNGLYDSYLWPVLGFIFAPTTFLWYSYVMLEKGGSWGFFNIFIMVIAVSIDLGGAGSSKRKKE